jgi:AP-1 complex subunit gamma-1
MCSSLECFSIKGRSINLNGIMAPSPSSYISIQAAGPKYMKLEMLPPSSSLIPASSSAAVTQEIRLTNTLQGDKPILLKLKISYKRYNQQVLQ